MPRNWLIITTERDRERAVKILQKLPLERPLLLTVDDYHERRSATQNARLWLLHQVVADHVGISASEMHEEALCHFFGYHEVTIGAFVRRIPNERSRVQDKLRFREFMDATENWYISEFGVFLPEIER